MCDEMHRAQVAPCGGSHLPTSQAEADMGDEELSLFAGEQLAFLTQGAVRAAIHRVPATAGDRFRLISGYSLM